MAKQKTTKAQRRRLHKQAELRNKGYPHLESAWKAHRDHKARDSFRK